MISFDDLPKRLFLDTSVLQFTQKFDCFKLEEVDINELHPIGHEKLQRLPKGITNWLALNNIYLVSLRRSFECVISKSSLVEVFAKGDPEFTQWAMEWFDHWIITREDYSPYSAFSGKGKKIMNKINSVECGYLSKSDKKLIFDSVINECDAFITMEDKLPKNYHHVKRRLGIKILRPYEYWELLEPWAALYV